MREFKTIWLCPYTARHDAKSSPCSPKPLAKLDAGGGSQSGWGIRDALAPLAYDCLLGGPKIKRRRRKVRIPEHIHLTHYRGEDRKLWLCSLEAIPMAGLSQLSAVNLQKDYYQLCSQQPHRNLGDVCPCSSTEGWHALWSSSMLRSGIAAQLQYEYSNNKWQ